MNNNIKIKIINEIEKNSEYFRKISDNEYKMKCIFCGDSNNPSHVHLYLKCSNDLSEPILYNCFKCNSKGKVNQDFLDRLGIKIDNDFDKQIFNKISNNKSPNINILCGNPILDSNQIKYIEYRLGEGFSLDDYKRFKILWNMDNVIEYITDNRIRNSLPSNHNSITFLSEDKSVLLTRSFIDEHPRWRKISLFPNNNRSLYTIKSLIDIFSKEIIYINIGEGIFDILSIYKNFNSGENSIYIATLGSDYISGINYAINKGFIGNNIIIKIFIDNDINYKNLKFYLKKYKWLFNKIIILRNINEKDFGVTLDKIQIVENIV